MRLDTRIRATPSVKRGEPASPAPPEPVAVTLVVFVASVVVAFQAERKLKIVKPRLQAYSIKDKVWR